MKALVNENSTVLRTKVQDFDFENSEVDTKELIETLIDHAKYYGGYSITANQLEGLEDTRVLVYGAGDEWNEMFNPVILEQSEKLQYGKEGCVNFPFLIQSVYRPQIIKIKYQLHDGEERVEEFTGFSARILSHSIDLLNGVVFTDVVSSSERARGKHRRKINKRRGLKQQRLLNKVQQTEESKTDEEYIEL